MRAVVVSSLLVAGLAGGEPIGPAAAVPALHTRGAFFALSVPDLDASARWYTEKLGLQVTMKTPRADGVAVAVLEGGGLVVELIQHDRAAPLGRLVPAASDRVLVHGLFKAGIVVDDFDGTVAALRTRAVEIAFGPFPKRPNQRANLILRDNAGNLIQILGP